MLTQLRISNLALIDEAEVKFGDGFNVLSGETGAGKSLLIGAVNLLLGGRGSGEMIRDGATDARVEGVFRVKDESLARDIAQAIGLEPLDGSEFRLCRTLQASGRNRCSVNGAAATLGMLAQVGTALVNIHGQHEQQALLHPDGQLFALDGFAQLSEARGRFAQLYNALSAKRQALEELQSRQERQKEQQELWEFQLKEIDDAAVRVGECEQLKKEQLVLTNVEQIRAATSEGYGALYECDGAVIEILGALKSQLAALSSVDDELAELARRAEQAAYEIEDLAHSLRQYGAGLDHDPERADQIESRLDVLRRLRAKYGGDEAGILAHRDGLERKLAELTEDGKSSESLQSEIRALTLQALEQGAALHAAREKAVARLSRIVTKELHALGMREARLDIQIETVGQGQTGEDVLACASPHGYDKIEFVFSANPGEGLKPLRKIASGGELSRVMLALKEKLAEVDRLPVLVFDEIDANVGARLGRTIGRKIASIAEYHQVICVTHLAQIASFADHHLRVYKFTRGGRTFTRVEGLRGPDREQELAEMIRGGEKTDLTLEQARQMLADASKAE